VLTVTEVSERLHLTGDTVRALIASGELRAIRTRTNGGHYRISEADLADYLERSRVVPAEAAPARSLQHEGPARHPRRASFARSRTHANP
jgi:excisionase family DNA binding protein